MPRTLVALDFDGTLAAIADDPAGVAIDPEARALLGQLAERHDLAVAIVSGRDLDDLRSRAPSLPLYLSGSHGLELVTPSGETLRTIPASATVPPDELIEEAGRFGLIVESKRHGVAFHWRTASADAPLARFRDRISEWASAHGLELIEGRKVFEARVPGRGKRGAVEDIASHAGAGRVLFAGDDLTDFEAIEWAASRGEGWLISSEERTERPRAGRVVSSRRELLEAIRRFTAR